MNLHSSPDVLLADPDQIKQLLADALRRGILSVFVGAGVSMSTAFPPDASGPQKKPLFPSWSDLVKDCCAEMGLSFSGERASNNDYLLRQAEAVEDECKAKQVSFTHTIENVLYANCHEYDLNTLKLDLLIAIGSLVMTSTRGSASCVINYNFDDLLEWYLMVHGFTVTVVSDLPTILPKADVYVYHPHGFLPRLDKLKTFRTDNLIFTKRSYQRAYKDSSSWNEFQRFRLGCNLCLFLGLSGDDEHIEWLYSTAHDQLLGKRILGIVILLDTSENREREQRNKNRGVIHLYIQKHDELPVLILEICRRAAEA